MLQKSLITAILVSFFSVLYSNAASLSTSAQISVLSCSPGDEAYSMYGHTAIRVKDPILNLDIVYNYGTFDVSDPNFYPNFCKGWLRYYLSTENFESFCNYYRHTNQSVIEQELLFTEAQKQKLYDALQKNALDENKYYNYDFFLDNCATRVFDIINQVSDNSIILAKKEGDTRFRTAINYYLDRGHQWLGVAINLVLTHRADRVMSVKQETFLPTNLMNHLATAQINEHSLVAKAQVLVQANDFNNNDECVLSQPTPLFLLFFFITLGVTMYEVISKHHFKLFSRILGGIYAFIGLFLIALWFYSDLLVVTYNLNLLWSLAGIVVFLPFKYATVRKAALVVISVLLLQLFLNQALPQAISVQSLLLSGCIQVRILAAWYFGYRSSQERLMKYE